MWILRLSVDAAYYTPLEMAARTLPEEDVWDGEVGEQFQRPAMGLMIAPGKTRSGYVFSRVDEGSKSFNVDVFQAGKPPTRMTFFVEVPGLRLDHRRT